MAAPVVREAGGPLTAKSLVCGNSHTCAVGLDDTLHCWGANVDGQIGAGDVTAFHNRAFQVPGITAVKAVAAHDSHTCAVLGSAAQLWCWGSSYRGQLGNGRVGYGLPPQPLLWK